MCFGVWCKNLGKRYARAVLRDSPQPDGMTRQLNYYYICRPSRMNFQDRDKVVLGYAASCSGRLRELARSNSAIALRTSTVTLKLATLTVITEHMIRYFHGLDSQRLPSRHYLIRLAVFASAGSERFLFGSETDLLHQATYAALIRASSCGFPSSRALHPQTSRVDSRSKPE